MPRVPARVIPEDRAEVAGPDVGRRWLMLAWQSHAGAIAYFSSWPDFAMEADIRDRVLSAMSGPSHLLLQRAAAPLTADLKSAVDISRVQY